MLIGTKTIAALFALLALSGGQLRGEVAPAPTGDSVAVVGDSYAAGIGAGSASGWAEYAALDLGWSVETVRAHPGAGYVNPGGAYPYEVALAVDPIPATVSQVIVQGGFNDIAFEPAEVGAAVSRTLELIHTQAPLAEVTVVGMFDPGPGNFTARYPSMLPDAVAIQQAVLAAGDRYVDGFVTPYEVGPDRSHPTPTGHAELGHAIADAIRAADPAAAGRRTGELTSREAAVIGVSRIGAFGARYFYLADTEGGQLGRVLEIPFGEAGDIPTLLPNAAGRCVPAVYRPSTGTLHVASGLLPGGGHVETATVGGADDQLVQNGAPLTPWGRAATLRRPAQSAFVMQTPGPDMATDVGTLTLGAPDDRGFVYSAEGIGSTLGVYRPQNSTFVISDPTDPAPVAGMTVPFGSPGDQGLVGAWGWSNVDGSDRLGVFRPSTGQWFLAGEPTPEMASAAAAPELTSFYFGNPGDTALACNPV